jgi:hypothetical protein
MAMPPPTNLDRELLSVSPVDDLDDRKLDRLRELRAEVQDLQRVLESVRRGESTLKTYSSYLRKTMKDVKELMSSIQDGDTVRHLHNSWEQMTSLPMTSTLAALSYQVLNPL